MSGGLLSLAPPCDGSHSPCALKRALCLLFGAGLGLAMSSCETLEAPAVQGGAFDDSYLGKRLDSNNPNLEDNQNEKGKTAAPSYSQWRHD